MCVYVFTGQNFAVHLYEYSVMWHTIKRLLLECKFRNIYALKSFIGRTDVEAETLILWPPDAKSWLILKRPWCWERLRAGGEGDDRGWDVWMASPTQWIWVWVNSGSWWWTGRPGVGSQRVGHDWATELNFPKPSYLCQKHLTDLTLQDLWL